MNSFDLHGKVAIVTGGNGGIGLGIARALAGAGAKVTLAGRNEAKTAAAVAELEAFGIGCLGIRADVTDAAQVQRMVEATVERFGGLDILVANAGINIRKRPEHYGSDEWHRIVDTNLTSALVRCQAVYPEMLRRGDG